jgi:membrane protein required for colicin V production
MIIDLLFMGVLLLAVIKGYSRGLVIAVFSLLALVIGLAAAMKLSLLAAEWLKDIIPASARILPLIAFALIFLVVVLLVRLAAKALEAAIEFALLGWVNRLGGILLYAVLYTVIFSILLFYAEKANLVSPETIAGSAIHAFLVPWGPAAMDTLGALIPFFKNMFRDLETFFSDLSRNIQGH